ncbi:hypothetical protein WMY93_024268 [Mugilogobius chulae]|uniref:Uncharacterized protein n=1 Tax=Mugilogobius chulae TaxID=88201 RepID=A0AAW0N0U7_9GOBI
MSRKVCAVRRSEEVKEASKEIQRSGSLQIRPKIETKETQEQLQFRRFLPLLCSVPVLSLLQFSLFCSARAQWRRNALTHFSHTPQDHPRPGHEDRGKERRLGGKDSRRERRREG